MPDLTPRPFGFAEKNIRPALDAYIDFFGGNKLAAVDAFIEDFASLVADDDDMKVLIKEKQVNAIVKHVNERGLSPEQKAIVMARVRENMERDNNQPSIVNQEALKKALDERKAAREQSENSKPAAQNNRLDFER